MNKPYGPIAEAWVRWSERVRGALVPDPPTSTPLERATFIQLRPPAPVSSATDTVIGWELDQRWIA